MEKLFKEFSPKTFLQWNKKVIDDLKGLDYEKLIWKSPEKISVAPLYNDESVKKFEGETTHHHSDWEIEQKFLKPTNKKVLDSLNTGATALLLYNLKSTDLDSILKEVLIEHIQTSIQSENIEDALESFVKLLEKRKLDKTKIRGSLHFDPLMSCLKNGTIDSNFWIKFNHIQEKSSALKSFKTLCIQGHEYHNSGATASQELAFTLAQLSEYFAHYKNLKATKIQISLGISTNFFFEIAKFRAIRILWSQLLDAYKKEHTPLDLRAESGLRTSTLYDAHINMLRSTSQCMSAALGGANTISINNLNAAYKEEDVFGSRMARNTSLILKEEAYLNKVSDPASGSYYIEELTNEMSLKAWSIFKEIEAHGGWIEAIKSNKIQQMIEENASKQEALFNAGELSLIGTNLHPNGKDKMLNELEISFVKNRTKPTEFRPLHSKRLSEQMDTIRLNEEKNA